MSKHNFPETEHAVIIGKVLTKVQCEKILLLAFKSKVAVGKEFFDEHEGPSFVGFSRGAEQDEIVLYDNCDNEDGSIILTFDEFCAYLQGKGNTKKFPVFVELNEEHTAEVSIHGIKVGCKEFTHDAIEKLYKQSKKMRDE